LDKVAGGNEGEGGNRFVGGGVPELIAKDEAAKMHVIGFRVVQFKPIVASLRVSHYFVDSEIRRRTER
jgi:hypothetical protein